MGVFKRYSPKVHKNIQWATPLTIVASGRHNTKNLLLTGIIPVMGEYTVGVAVLPVKQLPLWLGWFDSIFSHSQDREVESRKAHILENGGSNPPLAILEYNSVVEFHAFSVQCQWFDSSYSSSICHVQIGNPTLA